MGGVPTTRRRVFSLACRAMDGSAASGCRLYSRTGVWFVTIDYGDQEEEVSIVSLGRFSMAI
jgi:hypothetical protein